MKKKLLVILVALTLIITAILSEVPENRIKILQTGDTIISRHFFPFFRHDCRFNIGMAWSPNSYVSKSQRDFCAKEYFSSVSYRAVDRARGGIPIIRPHTYNTVMATLRPINYNGYLIVMNEPDRSDQDNMTVTNAVAFYQLVARDLPNATIITPNAIDPAFLNQFLQNARLRSRDIVGIHIYQWGNPPAPTIWPNQWLENIRVIVRRWGYNKQIWITEAGQNNIWTKEQLERYYREMLGNSLVAKTFVYTPWACTDMRQHACQHHLYNGLDFTFTKSGAALRAVMAGSNGYP